MIVADAVTTVHLVIEGDDTHWVEKVLREDPVWLVPSNWRSECLSAIDKYRRRGDFDEENARIRFRKAKERVRIEAYAPADEVLRLSARTDCSVYDCEYAAMARQRDIEFVTFDKQVIAAGLGVHPSEFLSKRD
jgi:predicted nucleic acid-binding protein